MTPFVGMPKIGRFSRECIVTEKIDGTNAQIYIPPEDEPPPELGFYVGSKSRWITPEQDNFGFARWAYDNAEVLKQLGPGHHFGEWWGGKIQRGYGLKEKRFSLFNVSRWSDERPACCDVIPILWRGEFDQLDVQAILTDLARNGSHAAPGFMQPEGIIIFHVAANVMFKKTIFNDEKPKGIANAS
jgi:hypothetical protein